MCKYAHVADKLIKNDKYYFYALSVVGVLAGIKFCDFLYYDEKKLLAVREQMEEDYWKEHGQPKHLKPELVQSLLRPGEMRNTWIKITMGKDKYISRPS